MKKIIKIYMVIFMMVFCYQSIVFAEEPDIVKRYKNVYDGKNINMIQKMVRDYL